MSIDSSAREVLDLSDVALYFDESMSNPDGNGRQLFVFGGIAARGELETLGEDGREGGDGVAFLSNAGGRMTWAVSWSSSWPTETYSPSLRSRAPRSLRLDT